MRCPSCQVPLAEPTPARCPFCKATLAADAPSASAADANVPAAVLEALAKGNKIEAIKRYREAHRGISLKDAKDFVEALAEGRTPPAIAPRSSASRPRVAHEGESDSSALPWMLVVAIVCFAAGVGFGVYFVR